MQSGHYKKVSLKSVLCLFLPYGLWVISFCVSVCRICLPGRLRPPLSSQQKIFFLFLGKQAEPRGPQHLDHKDLLLLWKQIDLWGFIQIMVWRLSCTKLFLHYLNRWWQQNQEFTQRYSKYLLRATSYQCPNQREGSGLFQSGKCPFRVSKLLLIILICLERLQICSFVSGRTGITQEQCSVPCVK